MNEPLARRHTSLFISSLVTLAMSLVLPRLIEWSPGMAGAASAALTFIALYFMSFSLAFYLIALSLFSRRNLSRKQQVMGFVPFLLVLITGGYILSRL
ncbi:MAG: hypothetical protein KZQ77_05605 [Candidatus Thiodiazotropha sp. (ex Notomyrtea botanica)]|nr:hypothetical protein [Candidatus Thiodiazotropha sp. (ex Notomyrtea botanica)]